MSHYTIDITREGKFWLIHIPELNGITQAYTWHEIPLMATEFISLMTGESRENITVNIHSVTLGDNTSVNEALRARSIAREADAKAAILTVQAARTLRDEGLPLREVGAVLGVSHQRAAQLCAA